MLTGHEYELFLTPAEHAWADQFIADHNLAQRRRIGFHVGSGGTKNLALRRWPLESYVALIQKLNHSRPDIAILLLAPEEEKDHARIAAKIGPGGILTPRTKNIAKPRPCCKNVTSFSVWIQR